MWLRPVVSVGVVVVVATAALSHAFYISLCVGPLDVAAVAAVAAPGRIRTDYHPPPSAIVLRIDAHARTKLLAMIFIAFYRMEATATTPKTNKKNG